MTVLLATKNLHKFKEINQMLIDTSIELKSLHDLKDNDEVEETGNTFFDNALLKAQYYYQKYHMPVLADDSGLIVDALNGQPGVFSARYTGEHATDQANNQRLLTEMQHISNRHAYFICVLVYIANDEIYHFKGRVHGTIAYNVQGSNGFGYDPLFMLTDGRRMSELESHEKNKLSHRYNAIKQWIEFLRSS